MVKPIRVLQVVGRMDMGGAETFIMNIYRNIDRTQIQFDFIVHTTEKCAYDIEIEKLGGRIYRIPKYTGKNHFNYIRAWHTFFKNHSKYKIIHSHIRSTAAIYLPIAKKYHLITIAHSHNTSSGRGFSAIIKNILQYPIRNIADHLFACSALAGEWLFGKKARISVIKNAIDIEKFTYSEEIRKRKLDELNIHGKFVIGHIGRFHSQKNHMFLIDVFAQIKSLCSNSVLLLVGDGILRTDVENKVKNLKLDDSVIFAGIRTDIPDLLQAMDVFVFPSLFEGLGIVLVEAQASGLPCVISNTVPNEAKITDLTLMVSLDKPAIIWAEKVLSVANIKNRRNTRDVIRNAGYDIKNVSRWLMEFYKSVHDKEV